MEAIVFITLQICFATHVVLKIGEYPRIFPGEYSVTRRAWANRARAKRFDELESPVLETLTQAEVSVCSLKLLFYDLEGINKSHNRRQRP